VSEPNRNTRLVQLNGAPSRRYYTGHNLSRAVAIEDLRAMTHQRMPKFVTEYLEGGSEDEATLLRERTAYAEWRFVPRQLVDVSHRSLATQILGRSAPSPLIVAPTGLNGLFRTDADVELAEGAARVGIPFCQSTMSNDAVEDVAKVKNLRHWWQLYVFGGDEVWQELLKRVDAAGCEALILTTNAQIFGNREWSDRTQSTKTQPSLPTTLDAALHVPWFASTLLTHGLPSFKNVIDFVPKDKRSFFESAFWIREHQPTSLSWRDVDKIRQRWKKPFILKGLLHPDDFRRALDAGVDGIVVSSHGGRQLDWTVAPLDALPRAREIVGDKIALFMSGGLRRGTDLLKAVALGADAVMAGRAPLYGLCAAGADGVERALRILEREADEAMGLLGASRLTDLRDGGLVVPASGAPPAAKATAAPRRSAAKAPLAEPVGS
jgi:(S)-mandelate dehydrogenase